MVVRHPARGRVQHGGVGVAGAGGVGLRRMTRLRHALESLLALVPTVVLLGLIVGACW